MTNADDNLQVTRDYQDGPTEPRTFGMYIEEVRKKRGMTRAALAQLSGISVHTLNNWERGNKMPSADNLALLCLYLRLDPRKALLYALGRGKGEWNDFFPDNYGSPEEQKNKELWAAFLAFMHDLDTSPPITDPEIKRAQPAGNDAQVSQLASAVAQLTATVAQILPMIAGKKTARFKKSRAVPLKIRSLLKLRQQLQNRNLSLPKLQKQNQ